MDKQWRNGSKQFIDFSITLTDPDGGLTLAEVQATPFQICVVPGTETPARTSTGWVNPSVPKVVTAVGASFRVDILHMYEVLEKGFYSVFVKFGPTPEEPIYLAANFVSL